MEISLIINYKLVFNKEFNKRHILAFSLLIIIGTGSTIAASYYLPYLINPFFKAVDGVFSIPATEIMDELDRIFIKPLPEPSRSLREIYFNGDVFDWWEIIKLKAGHDIEIEKVEILKLMEKYKHIKYLY